jgi:uncharacterized membrane protein (Fun14 family)
MFTSKKLLIFTILSFFLSIEISSAISKEKANSNSFRYLEDEDIEKRLLEEETDKNETYINCTQETCDLDHMNCKENNPEYCICKEEYASIKSNPLKCSIQRKKQLTAFLLELFVGFGAGHFYRHHYLMASLKLVAFVFGIYVICLFPLTAKCVTDCCDSDCLVVMVSIIFYLYAAGLATWYIFDLVYFGKNKWKDCSHDEEILFKPW